MLELVVGHLQGLCGEVILELGGKAARENIVVGFLLQLINL